MYSKRPVEMVIRSEEPLGNTLDLHTLLGKHVISKSGTIVGTVTQLRLHPTKLHLEGILVSRGWFKRKIYIGRNYVNRISHHGIFLTINPSLLLIGRTVLRSTGKAIGKVKAITRKSNSNDLASIVIGSLFRKDRIIPAHALTIAHEAIMLDANYDVKQEHHRQKS